jgi:hypothetical protein
MTVKYEYKSTCCGHEYLEVRAADEPFFKPTCNKCGEANYELVKETVLSETVERAAPDTVVEETPAE